MMMMSLRARDMSANVVRVVDCVCTSELLNGDIGLL